MCALGARNADCLASIYWQWDMHIQALLPASTKGLTMHQFFKPWGLILYHGHQ